MLRINLFDTLCLFGLLTVFACGIFLWLQLILKKTFLKATERVKQSKTFNILPLPTRTFVGIAILSIIFPMLCQKFMLWSLNWKHISAENVRLIALGTSSQVGLVCLLWLVFFTHPLLFSSLIVTPLSLKEIFTQAFKVYTLSLPLIVALSTLWQWVLKLLVSLGLKVAIDSQVFVQLLLKGQIPWPWLWHMFFFACVVAPLTEEILFRGFLLRFLMDRMIFLKALLLSGFIFAALHNHLASFLPLWGLGILLGIAYRNSGNLMVSIVFHSLFNTTMFLITLKMSSLKLL